jgi:signal transduction histidine kinase
MSGLIDNVLDLARSRLGGGIVLDLDATRPLGPTLEQVVEEMRAAYPETEIRLDINVPSKVKVDHQRIAQMFSNLLGNAVTYGAENAPIEVHARLNGNRHLELSVTNSGEPIAPEIVEHLFKPFHRGHVTSNAQGLGLGLYIASQIAQEHGGSIQVHSEDQITRFTFRMAVS